MLRYILRRLLVIIPIVLVLVLLALLMLNSLGGTDPRALTSYGEDGFDNVLAALHLHDTVVGRYLRYVFNLFTKLDLGIGRYGSVRAYLSGRMGITLKLTGCGLLFAVIIGVPAGYVSALHQNRAADHVLSTLTLALYAVPSYTLAVLLVILFCRAWQVLPSHGFDDPLCYIMPTLTIGGAGAALTTRMTRSAVLEVLGRQYITVLRAKGVKSRVITAHILRNALVPILTSLNNVFVSIFCGTLVAENLFTIPGMGTFLVSSVTNRWTNEVLGGIVFTSVLLMLVNLLCDVLSALADPQVRQSLSGRGRERRKRHA